MLYMSGDEPSGKREEMASYSSEVMMGHKEARWTGEVLRRRERRSMKISERVAEEGEDAAVAVISSTSFSWIEERLTAKVSWSEARTKVAILRRLNWVLRSASRRAEDAPTPNIIPADVGADRRTRSSGMRSLSRRIHCRRIGNHPFSARAKELAQKNFESLKASATSLLQIFDASGILDIAYSIPSVLSVTFRGYDFHRKVGDNTCVETMVAAAVMRSGSMRIFERLGTIEANMATTSSEIKVLRRSKLCKESLDDFSALRAGEISREKPKGLVVKVAERSRTKRSFHG